MWIMLELLLVYGEAVGVPAITLAVGGFLLLRINSLRAENTAQHEQGRLERVASEERLSGEIKTVDGKVSEVRSDVAYIKGSLGLEQ